MELNLLQEIKEPKYMLEEARIHDALYFSTTFVILPAW